MTEIVSSIESTVPSPSENINFNEISGNVLEDLSGDEVNKVDSSDDSDSAGIARKRNKNRTKRFSDSESDVDKENIGENSRSLSDNNPSTDSDDYTNLIKQRSKKSRIKNIRSDSESDTEQERLKESQSNIARDVKSRITNKRNKLREKFQNLLDSKGKGDEVIEKQTHGNESNNDNGSTSSNDEEIASINEIKKKIKEHTNNLKMAICDPDTSDDESSYPRHIEKPKKQQRRMKLTSPQPQRMSAKEAMENMKKIKSESNRMLREKEVSLPYHRPKALSLKDIMSRRKPAVSSDGKALPIKMNEDQLRQYALQLEQRQKEMIELCKSDSEEEEEVQNMTADDKQQADEMSLESSYNITESNNKRSEIISPAEKNGSSNSEISSEISISTSKDMQKSPEIRNTYGDDSEVLEFHNTVISDINTDITNVQDKSEDVPAEMEFVCNDSVEEANETNVTEERNIDTNKIIEITEQKENKEVNSINIEEESSISEDARDKIELASVANSEHLTDKDSQLISLRFDSEKIDSETDGTDKNDVSSEKAMDVEEVENNEFPDNELDDLNMEDIDRIIENADILQDHVPGVKFNSPALVKDTVSLSSKPILMGAPGMVIDLDGNDSVLPKKLTGVELLKERFIYFAKLKTPEEMERAKEKRQKPGAQHQKLRHDLEEKIAEQRSIEWAKRLESEKEQQKEIDAIRGELSDIEDEIDTIEAKLEVKESEIKASSSSEEEEEIEDDVLIEDKPRKKNPLVADEAEESDLDEAENDVDDGENEVVGVDCGADSDKVNDESDEDSSDDEESSESEDEKETKPKKSRILKAFEDSDDEETVYPNSVNTTEERTLEVNSQHATDDISSQIDKNDTQVHKLSDVTVPTVIEKVSDDKITKLRKSDSITESQDDDLQLAQVPKSNSEDLFTSQESISKPVDNINTNLISDNNDVDLGSQTFSIMTSNTVLAKGLDMELGSQEKMSVISETQPFDDNLDAVVGMCSGSFSQNYIQFKPPSTQTQNMESQAIGEDILDMCTGKFYDNEFVQTDDNVANTSIEISQESTPDTEAVDKQNAETKKEEGDILKSVLDELNEPEFESSKPMKYFFDGKSQNKENDVNNTQLKKKFVIDSDDDTNENLVASDKKKKKLKKKRIEKRALQISDDEDDEYSEQECDDLASENGDVQDNEEERLVEYDSEENEIVVMPQPKKKRKVADFFEQEAELTSEDEWAGSGDEDEAGLDRMEREAGDDDTFHQGRLQAELGQIHMRDVLDQDKREVRLIQELLFEDGDLGGGGRQRKFRWRNADGEDVTGTIPDELADTQEEEFESEEQWRKQRHEREMFLRQLKSQDNDKNDLNVSVTRTTIIKANLLSRTMSSVLEEANKSVTETTEITTMPEKKIAKDIPSPKKPFTVFQQNYHGSLLTRGRGALARLAALATPLAADDDAPAMGLVAATSRRNFVFATITPEDKEPKVTKRKAEPNAGTPRLVKKMRTEDKKQPKSSLLDHFKA